MKLVTLEELRKMDNGTVFSHVSRESARSLNGDISKGVCVNLNTLSVIMRNEDHTGFRGLIDILISPTVNDDRSVSYSYDYEHYVSNAELYKENVEDDFILINDVCWDEFEEDDLFMIYTKEEVKRMAEVTLAVIKM